MRNRIALFVFILYFYLCVELYLRNVFTKKIIINIYKNSAVIYTNKTLQMAAPPPFMGVKARRTSSADKQFLGDYLNAKNNVHLQKALQKTGL